MSYICIQVCEAVHCQNIKAYVCLHVATVSDSGLLWQQLSWNIKRIEFIYLFHMKSEFFLENT